MTREDILHRIRKVQELVNRGVGGEKESAEKRLAEMMEKYHITLADIEDEEKELVFWYKAKGHDWETIFKQVAVLGGMKRFAYVKPGDTSKKAQVLRSASDRPRGANVAIVTTYAKFLEVTTAYELYQKSFDEHYESFVYAFLFRNDLLGKGNGDHKTTPEEMKMLERSTMMLSGIEKVQVHKQLPSGNYLEE